MPRSLTGRLVVTVVALVAAVSVLVGAATALVMRGYLEGQLDEKVLASAHRAGEGPPGPLPERLPDDERRVRFGNQEPGTLVALPADGFGEVVSAQLGDGEPLAAGVLDDLTTVPSDGDVHQIDVDGHGSYRVAAVDTDDGLLVTGLPTADVDAAVGSLVRLELALAVLGTAAAAGFGVWLVRRRLRPLTEVAATAHAVAGLPLEEGEIGVTERVPGHLTDPRTEVGRVGAALNTLLAHVETSLDARHRSEQQVRQFVADASHELRTPLTTIAGYTQLARARSEPATTATALAKIDDESRRMTLLVEDLLLLARLDAGRPLDDEDVDLSRIALEAVDDARVVAPDHRWRVALPPGDRPVGVRGDGPRLRQVITNLLTNARKYTPPGSTVTLTVRADGFDVHDDGPGFGEDIVPTAFGRFTRADAARRRSDGAGLGLALVQGIVAAHGGTVTLHSAPGDTRIAVHLPPRDARGDTPA